MAPTSQSIIDIKPLLKGITGSVQDKTFAPVLIFSAQLLFQTDLQLCGDYFLNSFIGCRLEDCIAKTI